MKVEQKNPMEYGYLGDEQITISAKEFMLIKQALEAGISATMETSLPEITKYVNFETTEDVLKPRAEDLSSGKVVLVTDRVATFSQDNVQVKYDAKRLTREMVLSQELILEIHNRNVEAGVAIHQSALELAQ